MAEPKPRATLTHSLAVVLSAAATWLVGHAVAPAQAAVPSGVATAEQVKQLDEKLERIVERFEGRLAIVEKKLIFEEGARSANVKGIAR